MLPQKHRLSLSKRPQRRKREERLIQGEYFGLLVGKQDTDADSRFAIIVSAKVAKKATQRNRTKRRLTEAIRSLVKDTRKGFDIVLLVKKKATTASVDELQSSIQHTLRKAGIVKQ
ncbi:ribonuclease P protein component [Patescibacteria group bacterium]|nr:ribonuclease P protein component [Patescibacteria group bacterium]